VATKSYYELLELTPAASADDIKRCFRLQIAKYHPDKVQHLGQEFQVIAAERAAELTEAYRVLSRPELRAEYDRTLGGAGRAPSPAADAAAVAVAPPAPARTEREAPQPAMVDRGSDASTIGEARATRDRFVRYAAMARVRDVLVTAASDYDEAAVKGFDFARVPRSRLFGREKGSRLLAKFVTHVDGRSVAEAWAQAGRWASPEQVCVLLVGGSMATVRELADTITEQRRRLPANVTIVPVDARDWAAHIPNDAPALARDVIKRLRAGN